MAVRVDVVKHEEKVVSVYLGVYRSHDGVKYQVLGIARHPTTNEKLVVYEFISGHPDVVHGLERPPLYVYPLKDFVGNTILADGTSVPRFVFLGKYSAVFGPYRPQYF